MKRTRKLIKRELPPVGTNFIGKFKGKIYSSRIVGDKASPFGRSILYAGEKYSTMSAAAKAVTNQEANGWRFWKININS